MTLNIDRFGIILAIVILCSKAKKLKRIPKVSSTCKNLKFLLLLVGLAITLSGCFDFVEEIKLSTDGTGEVKYKLNLSKSKTKIGGIMLLDSIRGFAVPSENEIHGKLLELKNLLRNQNGISNVNIAENWSEYIFQLSMDFDKVSDLNAALRTALSKEETAKKYIYDAYSYRGSEFIRNYKMQEFNELSKWKADVTNVLNGANLILIHRFENPIISKSNAKYMVSKNGKSVMFKASFLDLKEKKVTLQNKTYLK